MPGRRKRGISDSLSTRTCTHCACTHVEWSIHSLCPCLDKPTATPIYITLGAPYCNSGSTTIPGCRATPLDRRTHPQQVLEEWSRQNSFKRKSKKGGEEDEGKDEGYKEKEEEEEGGGREGGEGGRRGWGREGGGADLQDTCREHILLRIGTVVEAQR